MRVEYKNTFLDITLFNAVHQFLSPVVQAIYLLLFGVIFWGESLSRSVPSAALVAFFWYIGALLFQFVLNAVYLYSTNNRSVLTTHLLEVRPDALLEETKFNTSLFYWPGVVKAVTRPGFVAVYVSGHQAHVVPNRSFASSSERAKFVALVRERIRDGSGEV